MEVLSRDKLLTISEDSNLRVWSKSGNGCIFSTSLLPSRFSMSNPYIVVVQENVIVFSCDEVGEILFQLICLGNLGNTVTDRDGLASISVMFFAESDKSPFILFCGGMMIFFLPKEPYTISALGPI